MKEIDNDIKVGKFKPLYLFYGEEKYLIKKYSAKLRGAIVPEEQEMMNCDIFEGQASMSEDIMNAAMTLPFMNDRRLVIVKDSALFVSGRKEESEKLAEFLKNIPEDTTLLFVEPEIDKRGRLYKAAAKAGAVFEFKPPSEPEMLDFVKSLLLKDGLSISKDSARYLLLSVAGDMETVELEAEKLIAYKEKGAEVSNADIDLICTKALEARIFELVGAIGQKNTKKALTIYGNMIHMKESPVMVLFMIVRQFRLILLSKYMNRRGESREGIAERLGLRSFAVSEYLRQAANFSESVLIKVLRECLETDVAIKTGKMDMELAVELLIMNSGGRG